MITFKELSRKATAIYIDGVWYDTVHPDDIPRVVAEIKTK